MGYSRQIQLAMIVGGCVYSLSYLSDRLRDEIDDQLPYVGILAVFIIGACVGMYAACLIVPRSFYDTSEGKTWINALSSSGEHALFRRVCWGCLSFLLLATLGTLCYVFLG